MTVELKHHTHIMGDPEMIIQLVGNLIQNVLSLGIDSQEISLVVHGAQLSLSDQGPGIPFDERERVLQPLYQLEKKAGRWLRFGTCSGECYLQFT